MPNWKKWNSQIHIFQFLGPFFKNDFYVHFNALFLVLFLATLSVSTVPSGVLTTKPETPVAIRRTQIKKDQEVVRVWSRDNGKKKEDLGLPLVVNMELELWLLGSWSIHNCWIHSADLLVLFLRNLMQRSRVPNVALKLSQKCYSMLAF